MNESVEQRREIVARYLNESASAEHAGPDMVKMGLVGKAKAREDGKLEIALSTEDRDRHGDILRSSGAVLTAFKKNPVLLFAHMHSHPAVGKVTNLKKGKRDKDGVGEITGLVEFALTPLGQELQLLYAGGFMKAFSVGFIPQKWDPLMDDEGEPDEEGGVDVKKWELLEVSAVPVPANPAALSRCDMSVFTGGTEDEVIAEMKAFRTAEDVPAAGDEEPVDDIRESFQEALEELRECIADGMWKPEEFESKEDEDTVEPDPEPNEVEADPEVDADTEAKKKYDCECIKCGHKLKSVKHCKDLKCEKCGGQMRRAERPGPGQGSADGAEGVARDTLMSDDAVIERIYGLTDAMAELKEVSEGTVTVLERILTIQASMDPDPDGVVDPKPVDNADPMPPAPVHGTPESQPEAGEGEPAEAAFTHDDALAMLKAGLEDITKAITETTATTIRAEMGRAVDIL